MKDTPKNISISLRNIPRILHGDFQLRQFLELPGSVGTWNGIRVDNLEFCIRLACKDRAARECQDGRTTETPYPHVYVKKPQSVYYSGTFSPRKAIVLIYPGTDFQKFCKLGLNADCLAWKIQLTPEITELIENLKKASSSLYLRGTPDRMDGLACQLIRELLIQNRQAESGDQNELRIRQAASWLTSHYMEPVDMDQFFVRFGFSRRNFYRCWQKVFDVSPKEYLRNLRLQEAERLLESHMVSVADIAWQMQFRDVSHFIRIFRLKNGLTPLQFQRNFSCETAEKRKMKKEKEEVKR